MLTFSKGVIILLVALISTQGESTSTYSIIETNVEISIAEAGTSCSGMTTTSGCFWDCWNYIQFVPGTQSAHLRKCDGECGRCEYVWTRVTNETKGKCDLTLPGEG